MMTMAMKLMVLWHSKNGTVRDFWLLIRMNFLYVLISFSYFSLFFSEKFFFFSFLFESFFSFAGFPLIFHHHYRYREYFARFCSHFFPLSYSFISSCLWKFLEYILIKDYCKLLFDDVISLSRTQLFFQFCFIDCLFARFGLVLVKQSVLFTHSLKSL